MWAVLALALTLGAVPPAGAIDEFLSTCTSAVTAGGQDTVPQRVLFLELGSDVSSCSSGVQAASAALQAYLSSAGRGDSVTYIDVTAATIAPDLTFIDQIWVRGDVGKWAPVLNRTVGCPHLFSAPSPFQPPPPRRHPSGFSLSTYIEICRPYSCWLSAALVRDGRCVSPTFPIP